MNRLWVRLSLAFSAVVLVGVAAIIMISTLMVNTTVRQRFLVNEIRVPGGLVDELTDYYQIHHGWDGVEVFLAGTHATLPRGPGDRLIISLADAEGHIIYHMRKEKIGQWLNQAERAAALPIQVAGVAPQGSETVGYLLVERAPAPRPVSPQQLFLSWVSRLLLLVAAVGGTLGILFGVLTSRNLTAPLNHLAEAARAIGARELSRRVEVTGSDEVKEVAQAFNDMATGLEKAETLRRNLMADVAHELRTPLSVLQGNLRAILDNVYPLDKSEIARLYDQTRFLGHLVEDLRELAQAEAGQLQLNMQLTNLNELVQNTTATFAPIAEGEGVALSVQLPADLPPVQADPGRIGQVLHNLLDNALRHTPSGGMISIGTGSAKASARLGRGEVKSAHVWLEVKDTGEGISSEHLPHVFDRFYRADPARSRTSSRSSAQRSAGGSGLGLAIVRAIAEAHGGEVNVESDGIPGRGSTFIVRLPL